MLSIALSLGATELSGIFSISMVVLCFCALILFITRNMMVLRMHGDDFMFHGSMHQHMPAKIPQMNMMKVHIPFTFKLLETLNSSYSDVQCNVSSQVNCRVKIYWGVSIKELHVCLWRPWSELRDNLMNCSILRGHYQYSGEEYALCDQTDKTLNLSLTEALDLGTPPRLCYPLVIIIYRTDKDGNVHPNETVALINVVHIKDAVCPLGTSVLAQYLKQANGQLSCLKQLYLATGNSATYEDNQIPLTVAEPVDNVGGNCRPAMVCPSGDESAWNMAGEQLCVVCQYFPLSRALLPCRHTCICASCFDKIDRCPMCRGPIKSYFCIRGEEYMPIQTEPKTQSEHSPIYHWIDSLNDRIIDFLGFQR